jgi:DNA-binding transcriptional ArsR family regulator
MALGLSTLVSYLGRHVTVYYYSTSSQKVNILFILSLDSARLQNLRRNIRERVDCNPSSVRKRIPGKRICPSKSSARALIFGSKWGSGEGIAEHNGFLAGHFTITRTAVNKHLYVLTNAGLLDRRKVGRETRYKLNPGPLLELEQWLSYYERYWEGNLNALKKYVEDDRE